MIDAIQGIMTPGADAFWWHSVVANADATLAPK